MSRIDDLLNQFCPEGAAFRSIMDVSEKCSTVKWFEVGGAELQYIDLATVDRVSRKIGPTTAVTAMNAPDRAKQIVRSGDVIFATTRPTQMRWAVIPSELDGQLASTGYCVIRPITSIVLTKFLAHLLGTNAFRQYIVENQVAGNYPSIPDRRVRGYRVPVPPLEVQREIVRILDTFTELEGELEGELEARTRQYAYYRECLFEAALESGRSEVEMGEIGTFIRGRRFTREDMVEGGLPCIHYGEIYTTYGVSTTRAESCVRPDLAGKLRFAQPGDVIIAAVGETVEDVGKAVAWLGTEPVAIHDDTFLFRSNVHPKYVAHYMQTSAFHSQKNKFVARAKVKRLSSESLSKIKIPVIAGDEQKHVVEILDKFEELVGDLKSGLPAELAARRQQYEHYRDRLLTFDEVINE